MAFDGTADYTLDAKNRLTVPARFRDELRDGLYLVKDTEQCVAIWPKGAWDEHRTAMLDGLHPMSRQAKDTKRFFAAISFAMDLDAAGRVAVPKELLGHANLGREVTVIGADDHLEVWDRDAWLAYNASLVTRMADFSRDLDTRMGA